jgi:hypothetical protein
MKRLFSGVAFAALIAVAAPVWAQAPTIPPASNAPSANPPAAQAPATAPAASKNASAEKAKPAPKQESTAAARGMQRPMRHAGYARHVAYRGYAYGMHPMWMHRRYGWSHPYYRGWGVYGPTDFMARQLNRQELAQISSGGGTPYAPRSYPRSGY